MPQSDEIVIEVDPNDVRFTHSKIRPVFSDGKKVLDTLNEIKEGRLRPDQLPMLTVVQQHEHCYYSMNNRRLWVLKQCRELGLLPNNLVQVRMRPMPDTKRLKDRFSVDKCSNTAKFMSH